MKSIGFSGGVIITAPRSFRRVGMKHDHWPDHAYIYSFSSYFFCASGAVCVAHRFTLADGTGLQYWGPLLPSEAAAILFLDGASTFRNPDGIVGAFGEWFNFVARPHILDKCLIGDVFAWLAIH